MFKELQNAKYANKERHHIQSGMVPFYSMNISSWYAVRVTLLTNYEMQRMVIHLSLLTNS